MSEKKVGRPRKENKGPRLFKKPHIFQIRLKEKQLNYFSSLIKDKYSPGKFMEDLLNILMYYHVNKPEILMKIFDINFYNRYFKEEKIEDSVTQEKV